MVSIQNIESGAKRELLKNTVANSLPDGSLDVRVITSNELEMLNNMEEDSGESDNSTNENDGDSSDDLQLIKVVPNPYIANSDYFNESPGNNLLRFTRLPNNEINDGLPLEKISIDIP